MHESFDSGPRKARIGSCKSVTIRKIYFIIGGCSQSRCRFFDAERGTWSSATPMEPVYGFDISSYFNKIYLVDRVLNGNNFNMIAQVYEEETDSWTFIAPPNIIRAFFSLIAYREKLYIFRGIRGFGGFRNDIKNIEVYDMAENKWEEIESPFQVDPFCIEVFIINDRLLITDHKRKNYHVLNDTEKKWEPTAKPFHIQHMRVELVHTIYDEEIIKALVKHNTTPMEPVYGLDISSYFNKIYLVDRVLNGNNFNMIAQVYEEETDSLTFIAPPNIIRAIFSLIAYREKLYIFSGIRGFGGFRNDIKTLKCTIWLGRNRVSFSRRSFLH